MTAIEPRFAGRVDGVDRQAHLHRLGLTEFELVDLNASANGVEDLGCLPADVHGDGNSADIAVHFQLIVPTRSDDLRLNTPGVSAECRSQDRSGRFRNRRAGAAKERDRCYRGTCESGPHDSNASAQRQRLVARTDTSCIAAVGSDDFSAGCYTNVCRSMWGCILGSRTFAAVASRRRRRVAAWRSIRAPRRLSRIGPSVR